MLGLLMSVSLTGLVLMTMPRYRQRWGGQQQVDLLPPAHLWTLAACWAALLCMKTGWCLEAVGGFISLQIKSDTFRICNNPRLVQKQLWWAGVQQGALQMLEHYLGAVIFFSSGTLSNAKLLPEPAWNLPSEPEVWAKKRKRGGKVLYAALSSILVWR